MMVVFDFGETRHVKLIIHSTKNEDFRIISANYILKKDGKIESQGISSIFEHIIDTVITPKEKGDYTLQITYKIADEVLIENIGVTVL